MPPFTFYTKHIPVKNLIYKYLNVKATANVGTKIGLWEKIAKQKPQLSLFSHTKCIATDAVISALLKLLWYQKMQIESHCHFLNNLVLYLKRMEYIRSTVYTRTGNLQILLVQYMIVSFNFIVGSLKVLSNFKFQVTTLMLNCMNKMIKTN